MTTERPARLHVDWTACDRRGSCIELLPELLDADDWGYPMPREGHRDLSVDGELTADVLTAVKLCPRLALTLTPGS
jgi:ferredoxin